MSLDTSEVLAMKGDLKNTNSAPTAKPPSDRRRSRREIKGARAQSYVDGHKSTARHVRNLIIQANSKAKLATEAKIFSRRQEFGKEAITLAERAAKFANRIAHMRIHSLLVKEALELPEKLNKKLKGNSEGAAPYELPARIALAA